MLRRPARAGRLQAGLRSRLEAIDTIVIGAGPAGLATAACLGRRQVPHVVLEREQAVGWSWRHHYERLHLHTAKRHSALPHRPFPGDYPRYPSRQQVVDYLDDYARHFGIAPRFGCTVTSVGRVDGAWETRTDPESVLRSRCVVVATSYNQEPNRPTWPGEASFAGRILHSSAYQSAAPFEGQRVMVVGAGNSGAEIALDLCEHGAETCLSVRGPVTVTVRDFFRGLMPVQVAGIMMRRLPPRLADRLSRPLIRAHIGDTSRLGLGRPTVGPFSLVRTGRIPLIDIGTVAQIEQGRLTVVPAIARFEADGVVFEDGARRPLDAVILATGFHCRLDRFLDGADALVDPRGYPRWYGREAALPGLYFVGYANPVSGALREIGIEARRVARDIGRGWEA